jgi:hypothetical protein
MKSTKQKTYQSFSIALRAKGILNDQNSTRVAVSPVCKVSALTKKEAETIARKHFQANNNDMKITKFEVLSSQKSEVLPFVELKGAGVIGMW